MRDKLKEFLSTSTEIHAFGLGFISWFMTSMYLPGGRMIVIGVVLATLGYEYTKRGAYRFGRNIIDPQDIPDDIRDEPHYFAGGVFLAVLVVATLKALGAA